MTFQSTAACNWLKAWQSVAVMGIILAVSCWMNRSAVGQEPRSAASDSRQSAVASDQASAEKPVKPTGANLEGIAELAVGREFTAQDTLNCGQEDNEDARECLDGLSWQLGKFKVQLAQPRVGDRMERMVRFDSPLPLGDSTNDLVAVEWYVAHDELGRPVRAPAMVVVHESGSGMTVGRMIAQGLRAHGLHTFMMQMPGYGVRKSAQIGEAHAKEADALRLIPAMKQAIADARRARDAVAALPYVDSSMIGIQGTSLGGFVTATVGGFDAGFDRVFVLLAGGDLNQVIFNGAKDAANVRQRLEEAGATPEMIKEGTRHIEPLRVAHRVRPEVTWLYSGKFDDVVPPACSHALAKAASLSAEHHIEMPVDHYSGALYIPKILLDMAKIMESPKYKK
ncbi:MAG: prolyl oligopeptidase family serine peptidase [Pirellulaceae bacterium]|nr:prolyl oligopeptidase family serine peptidase [Pirellulaceae bacterium]